MDGFEVSQLTLMPVFELLLYFPLVVGVIVIQNTFLSAPLPYLFDFIGVLRRGSAF